MGRTRLSCVAVFAAALVVMPGAATMAFAQGAAAPLAVGTDAPDFTFTTVTKDGARNSFTLSEHRGETVVLAFFPKARTSGCTTQMETYRDQYSTMFLDGKQVRLIGISTDSPDDLTAWAKDAGFPFAFGSDADKAVGALYNTATEAGFHRRYLYVIGPDGKIAYSTNFRAMAQDAYDELGTVVGKVAAAR